MRRLHRLAQRNVSGDSQVTCCASRWLLSRSRRLKDGLPGPSSSSEATSWQQSWANLVIKVSSCQHCSRSLWSLWSLWSLHEKTLLCTTSDFQPEYAQTLDFLKKKWQTLGSMQKSLIYFAQFSLWLLQTSCFCKESFDVGACKKKRNFSLAI